MLKFGFASTKLAPLAMRLGSCLGVSFQRHESDLRGGQYFRAETLQGTIFLQTNFDVIDHAPVEQGWPPHGSVLYLDGPDDNSWQPVVERLLAAKNELGLSILV